MFELQQLFQRPDVVTDASSHDRSPGQPPSWARTVGRQNSQRPMRSNEVSVGSPEIELPLEIQPVLGKGQCFSTQPSILLTHSQVLAFHISGINLPFVAIGTSQTLGPRENFSLKTEYDAAVYLNYSASLATFVYLGITQEGMRNKGWIPGPASLTRGIWPLPDAKHLQEDVSVVLEGI